jgi:hypothetical protein
MRDEAFPMLSTVLTVQASSPVIVDLHLSAGTAANRSRLELSARMSTRVRCAAPRSPPTAAGFTTDSTSDCVIGTEVSSLKLKQVFPAKQVSAASANVSMSVVTSSVSASVFIPGPFKRTRTGASLSR